MGVGTWGLSFQHFRKSKIILKYSVYLKKMRQPINENKQDFPSPSKKVFLEKQPKIFPDEISIGMGLSQEPGGGTSGFGVGSSHFSLEMSS